MPRVNPKILYEHYGSRSAIQSGRSGWNKSWRGRWTGQADVVRAEAAQRQPETASRRAVGVFQIETDATAGTAPANRVQYRRISRVATLNALIVLIADDDSASLKVLDALRRF